MTWLRRLRRYTEHDDPLSATANLVALVIAGNQPFYPLYVLVAVGWVGWPSFCAYLVMPLFFSVPAVTRRWPLLGRIWFCLLAIGNSVLTTKVLGQAAGVELFLLPCGIVSTMLFRRRERPVMLAMTGLTLGCFFLMQGRYGAPIAQLTADQAHSLLVLHAASVGTLTAFMGIVFSGLFDAAEAARAKPL